MNPTSPAATVLDEVGTWAGITTQPTSRGATAILFEGHELGHVHPNRGTLDLPLPADRRAQVLEADGPRNGSPAGSASNSRAAPMQTTGVDEEVAPGRDDHEQHEGRIGDPREVRDQMRRVASGARADDHRVADVHLGAA